jgi:hypothetical protein
VANGALAWYFDGSVAARISRYHYGIQVRQKFSPNNLEHAGRVPYLGLNGQFYIRSAWGLLLAQVRQHYLALNRDTDDLV